MVTGYEVYYSTKETSEFTSAGFTTKTEMNVKGLKLNTRYYFKVKAIGDKFRNLSKESKTCYTNTKADYKPSTPEDVKLEKLDNGNISLSWRESNSCTGYDVYRADTRFGNYTRIAQNVSKTEYVDTNPNTTSKYKNYYKIKAVNTADQSEFSQPVSLEIDMFGLNTYVFNPEDDMQEIKNTTESIFNKQHYNQFGKERYTYLYKPGNYVDAGMLNMGYYTQALGLGTLPTDVELYNVNTPAALDNSNTTCNFWIGLENVKIKNVENINEPTNENNAFKWGASQAAPARRLYVERNGFLQWNSTDTGSWASGGYIADSYFKYTAGSYTQQQYYNRNNYFGDGFWGVNWNSVLQGCTGAIKSEMSKDNTGHTLLPEDAIALKGSESIGREQLNIKGVTNWVKRGCMTSFDTTPVMREKPFMYFDDQADTYKVFIPALRKNASGPSWTETDMGEGTSITVNDKHFYIAKPGVSADKINEMLIRGKNIIFTPGIYKVDKPIKVTKADTLLIGLGMATITPSESNSDTAIKVEDVGGVQISGLLLDAGYYSESLLQVGDEGNNKDHADNPTMLQDVIFRVGGTGDRAKVKSAEVINSNDVIIDHTWIWRADHGAFTGWTENTADNGVVVNGDNVAAYGLFVEHFQEYDVLWRGEYGATYFLQNEKCYDPQDQASWMSHGGAKKGYAAYKVANNVKHHYAANLGVYDVFINTNGASIFLDNAIEVPNQPDVMVENAVIVEIANGSGPQVGINNIINNTAPGITTGATAPEGHSGFAVQKLLTYNNSNSVSLTDYYQDKEGTTKTTEIGETPTIDSESEKNITKDKLTKDEEVSLWLTDDNFFDKKSDQGEIDWANMQKNQGDDNHSGGKNNGGSGNAGLDDQSQNYAKFLKVGNKFDYGKYRYVITKADTVNGKAEVAVYGVVTKYKKKLKTASIPSSVIYINPLDKTKHQYPSTVTGLNKNAFKKLKKLKTFKGGKQLKTIKGKAFVSNKKLKKVTLGNKVTNIAKNAFYKNNAMTTVKIGNKLKTLKTKAFNSNKKLKSVTVGKGLKTIKANVFYKSKKLAKFTVKGTKVKKVSKKAFDKAVKRSITIKGKKKSVKKILKALGR